MDVRAYRRGLVVPHVPSELGSILTLNYLTQHICQNTTEYYRRVQVEDCRLLCTSIPDQTPAISMHPLCKYNIGLCLYIHPLGHFIITIASYHHQTGSRVDWIVPALCVVKLVSLTEYHSDMAVGFI